MSEEIKARARAEAARILGTTPGCSTCLTVGQRLAHQRAMHEGFVEETREGWRADADTIARLTRERDEARDRIAALEAQLTTRGACECGADDVCALARRAQEAERERDEAQRKVAALTEGLRLVSDALARLDNIYRADTDLGDPPVETPAWLQEAQHRAVALLTPTAPAAGAGLRSARVNSAGNLCLMPAGHAVDHYPPTERAPQVIVRTDGTGPNPTPAPEQSGEGECHG